MQYTSKESLEQVLKRSERVRKKRERQRLNIFGLSVCAVLLTLTLALSSVPAKQESGDMSVLGSFLLDAKTGGIITAVLLAFVLGALVTLFAIRQKQPGAWNAAPGNAQNAEENKEEDEEGGTRQ